MKVIWLASYPRSGVTFLRRLIESCGFATVSVHGDDDRTQELGNLGTEHYKRLDYLFVKTHIEETSKVPWPAIHLIRDGRDAIVSHMYYIFWLQQTGSRTPEQIMEDLIRGRVVALPRWNRNTWHWGLHGYAWQNRQHRIPVYFEDLVTEPRSVLAAIFKGLGIGATMPERIPTFDQLHAEAPRFYRRGLIGSHKDEMPQELQDLFWQEHGEMMESLGYSRTAPELVEA